MYLELSTSHAIDLLLADTYAGWSYEAAEALVQMFEEYEEEIEPVRLDVVAIRCDWGEYDLERLEMDYGYLTNDGGHDERAPCRASREDWGLSKWADFLRDHTSIIELENSLLVAAF